MDILVIRDVASRVIRLMDKDNWLLMNVIAINDDIVGIHICLVS